jgi:type II secretory pathway predicted ATPase ExeA
MKKVTLPATRDKLPVYHRIHRALASAPEPRKRLIELAVNEAEALAWQTGLPDLVFLTLAEEKLDALDTWLARQEKLRVRTAQWSLSE